MVLSHVHYNQIRWNPTEYFIPKSQISMQHWRHSFKGGLVVSFPVLIPQLSSLNAVQRRLGELSSRRGRKLP